jgi:hypothetical protein
MKTKQQIRRLGISLTATFIRAGREPDHNNGYGPLPEKVGRPLSKLKSSTTAHARGGVTPYSSLCNSYYQQLHFKFFTLIFTS